MSLLPSDQQITLPSDPVQQENLLAVHHRSTVGTSPLDLCEPEEIVATSPPARGEVEISSWAIDKKVKGSRVTAK